MEIGYFYIGLLFMDAHMTWINWDRVFYIRMKAFYCQWPLLKSMPCKEGLVDDAFTLQADKDQLPLLR